MRRFSRLLAAGFLAAGLGVAAWFLWQETRYEPEVGQAGKDVIWVPTPEPLVTEMLEMAQVRPGELVVDLGSGDGRVAITAVREFGAVGRGIEFNPDMVALSRRLAREAGVADRAVFVEGDIFAQDFTDADVVTMYLLPSLNLKLRPQLLDMAPGTRIVSHSFDMGDWPPDQEVTAGGAKAFLWIVPARVDAAWRLTLADGRTGALRLQQSFQRVAGEATVGDQTAQVEGRLSGETLTATLRGAELGEAVLTARVSGGTLTGELRLGEARVAVAGEPAPEPQSLE